jgi:hypothetical protein
MAKLTLDILISVDQSYCSSITSDDTLVFGSLLVFVALQARHMCESLKCGVVAKERTRRVTY